MLRNKQGPLKQEPFAAPVASQSGVRVWLATAVVMVMSTSRNGLSIRSKADVEAAASALQVCGTYGDS